MLLWCIDGCFTWNNRLERRGDEIMRAFYSQVGVLMDLEAKSLQNEAQLSKRDEAIPAYGDLSALKGNEVVPIFDL